MSCIFRNMPVFQYLEFVVVKELFALLLEESSPRLFPQLQAHEVLMVWNL